MNGPFHEQNFGSNFLRPAEQKFNRSTEQHIFRTKSEF